MQIADDRSRNRILVVLFLGVLMGALDIAIVGPALPALGSAFDLETRALSWVFSIYVLCNLIGTPLMAKLSDGVGRRRVYMADVAIFALGSAIVAAAPTFGVLLAGRAVQGLGAGGIFPVASAVIGDTFPLEKRGRALGMIGAVFGLAFLIGPVVGGVLLTFGWRWLFVVNLPLAAAVLWGSLRILPQASETRRPTFDWQGVALLAGLLSALSFGINQLDTSAVAASIGSLRVWPFLLLGVLLVPAFVWVEGAAKDPIVHLSLFTTRQARLVLAVAAGAGLGEASVVFVPDLLVDAFNVSQRQAAFMLLPVVLAMAVGAPTAGRLLDRYGSRVIIFAGTALLALGMAAVAFVSTTIVGFYAAGLLVGLGLSGLLGGPLRYVMLNEAPRSERAAAQGALTLSTGVGQLVGGALVGAVAGSIGGVHGYRVAYLVVGVAAACLAAGSLGLKAHAAERATARATAE